MHDNRNGGRGRVKRSHHKDTCRSRSQSQDTRDKMSTSRQHQAWRHSYLEVRTDQVVSTGSGKTGNKVWHRSSEGRTYEGFTHSGIGELHSRVWNSHNGGSPSGSVASELGVRRSVSKDRTHKKDASPRLRVSQHEAGRSGPEDSSVREGAHAGPGLSQHRLVRSVSEDRSHKGGASLTSGALPHRLRRSGLDDSNAVSAEKVPNTYMGLVNAAMVVKLLAQLYEGHVDTKKAAELFQVCKPQFLQELKEFIHTASPDTAFLSNFATFCSSAFISLPSSVCVQFENTLMASLSAVEKSENASLKDRFARLREKLTEHVCKKRELDVRVTFQNFRFIPVLPVQADAFFFPDRTVAAESSAEQSYLSELFFSLYEAFLGRIRDGIRSFRDTEGTPLRLPSVMHFYRGVKFLIPVVVNDRLCLTTNLTSVDRLSTGTLVCFSCNGFRSLLFAIVECANTCIVVRPCGKMHRITKQLFEDEYVMAVSGLCAQPSVSVLLALQQLKVVPLQKFLVEGVPVPGRKHCVQGQSDLDPWQREALSHALGQDICLVLGPPGSGKTRVACTVARNSRSPVLVLCESRSGLNAILRHIAPLSIACLSDRTKHQHNQQRREIWARRKDVLVDLKRLGRDLALLARNDGVVALSSLREGGVISSAHYSSFLHQPDTNSVFYSWLVDEASFPNEPPPCRGLVPYRGDAPCTEDTELSTVHPSLKWAERLENVEKKRSEVKTNISSLQERWGRGEDVAKETNVQKELYRLLAFKLKRLRTRLAETWPSDGLRTCCDVWKLKPIGRWGLYFAWVAELRARLLDKFEYLQDKLAVEDRNLEIVDQRIDLENAHQMAVVGTTAEEAMRLNSLLEKLAPEMVIVDEATNITEAQLMTCLPQSCRNLVLLGEPSPLQDTLNCQKAQSAHLHSLVHRLVEKGMAVSELKSQHRMQPHVAKPIMSTLYPGLETCSDITDVCTIKGVSQNMFFITHEHLAEKVGNISDYKNLHEAAFLFAFCYYLLLQGYSAQDIAIITTYPSQQHYLQQECESLLQMRDVRVCLVEEFRGQECKIVLVSTVHEDDSRPCTAEYISMMLTRAQEGLYIIGNLQQLTKSNTVWSVVQKSLEKHGVVGTELLLRCEVHQDKLTAVSSSADFSQVKKGGCILPCNPTLKCGNSCQKQCHMIGQQSDLRQCKQHQQRDPSCQPCKRDDESKD